MGHPLRSRKINTCLLFMSHTNLGALNTLVKDSLTSAGRIRAEGGRAPLGSCWGCGLLQFHQNWSPLTERVTQCGEGSSCHIEEGGF